jgi:hypothetical protein
MGKKIEIKRNGIFVLVDIQNGNRTELYKTESFNDMGKYLIDKGVI